MKLLILFIGIALARPEGEEFGGKFFEVVKSCAEKEGVSVDDAVSFIRTSKNAKTDPSKEVKCLQACVMEQFKKMTPDGQFNTDQFKIDAAKICQNDETKINKLTKIYEECTAKIDSTDRCERAFEFDKCFRPQMKEVVGRFMRGTYGN